MPGSTIRVGIIGLGAISFAHEAGYAALPDRCRLVALCDLREDEARQRAAACDARAYTRYTDLLSDPEVDMVDILVPHHQHYEIARAAIERGKHVLVEKPITARSADGLALIELARQAGVSLGVAENTRFVTAYQRAEEILRDGRLGEVWTVRTLIAGSEVHRIKDPSLWHGKAPYGGVILDSAVHTFYLFRWLFGGVRQVRGFASKIVPEGEVEDNGLVLGQLANGAEFQLGVSCTMEIPWTERLEVYGSRGGLIVDQLADPVAKLYQGSADVDGSAVEGIPFDPLAWKFNAMMSEVEDFVNAILERRPTLVETEDTVYALQAVEAVYRSIEMGRAVTLPA